MKTTLFLILVASVAMAAPSDLDFMKSAYKAMAERPTDITAYDTANEWTAAPNCLRDVENYLENNDYRSAERAAESCRKRSKVPELVNMWDAVIEGLRTEQETRVTRMAASLSNTFARARSLCQTATKAEEFDSMLDELYELQQQRSGNWPPSINRQWNRIDQAVNFLQQWQEVLSQIENGEKAAAVNTMRNLRSYGYNQSRLLTRSEILSRVNAMRDESEVSSYCDKLAGLKLADLPDLIEEISDDLRNRAYDDQRNELQQLQQALANLYQVFSRSKARSAELANLYYYSGQPGACGGEMAKLHQRVVSELFAARLKISVEELEKLGGDPDTAISAMSKDAFEKENWKELLSLAQTRAELGMYRMGSTSDSPVLGLQQFLAGQRLEKAEQWEAAAECYREVLKQSGDYVPYDKAAERLKALQPKLPVKSTEEK